MTPSPQPRIVRREAPPKTTGRVGYRKAEPHLRRDFDYRCAYCMVHEEQIGGKGAFCIDHFKPRSKGGRVNDYANLYWVCIPCNTLKHDKWPTPAQQRKGYRFADPCREQDYGIHLVESEADELLPQTPCGEYHISVLRLNRAWLRSLRRERTRKLERLKEALALLAEIEQGTPTRPNDFPHRSRLLSFLRSEIEILQRELTLTIPYIVAP